MISEGLRKDSKWAPYLAVLPRQLDSLAFWSDSELAQLQASTVVNKIGKAGAEELFSQHIAPLGLEDCDPEMCHRVASIIMAYAFDIPEEGTTKDTNQNAEDDGDDVVSDDGEDEKTILSMIPLADMLNADADRNNARLCCDNEDLEIRTIKPIRKGEEIFNDYGQLPRSDLLRRYGYVTENYAAYDVAEIPTQTILSALQSREASQLFTPLSKQELQNRIELSERENVYEDSYDICHPSPDGPSIPDELLALLYLLLLDQDNSEAILNSQTALPSRSKLVTELIGKVLVIILRIQEKEYGTTLEEDENLLESGHLSDRAIKAIQVRIGEKAVLRKAIQEATTFAGSDKRMRVVQSTKCDSEVQDGKGKRASEETSKLKKKGRFR
jgi:SET domain-containing protein 6